MTEVTIFEQQGRLSFPVVRHEETTYMLFFTACIRETLRIAPPTPIILPRYVSAHGLVINNILIPEKTEIAANPHIAHRNKKIFGADADMFRPERWLEGPETNTRLMDKYDLAWGYGNRKCVGKNLSLFETQKLCVQVTVFLSDYRSWAINKLLSYSDNSELHDDHEPFATSQARRGFCSHGTTASTEKQDLSPSSGGGLAQSLPRGSRTRASRRRTKCDIGPRLKPAARELYRTCSRVLQMSVLPISARSRLLGQWLSHT